MTDIQTLFVSLDARRGGGGVARFLTAGVALTLAVLVPAHAAAQAPAVAPAPVGSQLIGLLPSLIGGDAANDFNTAMVSQLSTYPGGSSAGGFTFTFNPTTQAFARSSDSFGPSFADRAMTMGRDTFNVGVTFQRATYDTFEGLNLSNGDVRFRVDDQPNPGDVIDAQLSIDLSTDVVVFEFVANEFDGEGASEHRVGGQVETAHAALVQEALDLVPSNPRRERLRVCHHG
jgi:hypothetical protein